MQTYLTEPIYLYGIKIGHTYQGTIDLIAHYQHILAIAQPHQMDERARQHCKQLVENLLTHKALYEKYQAENPTTKLLSPNPTTPTV